MKTSKYQVSFKTKQLWFVGPNLPQKGVLGMEFKKAIVEFWISTFEYLFRPTFIQNEAFLSLGTTFA